MANEVCGQMPAKYYDIRGGGEIMLVQSSKTKDFIDDLKLERKSTLMRLGISPTLIIPSNLQEKRVITMEANKLLKRYDDKAENIPRKPAIVDDPMIDKLLQECEPDIVAAASSIKQLLQVFDSGYRGNFYIPISVRQTFAFGRSKKIVFFCKSLPRRQLNNYELTEKAIKKACMLTWAHKKVDKKAIDDYRMKKKESSSPRKSKSQEIEIGNEASKSSSILDMVNSIRNRIKNAEAPDDANDGTEVANFRYENEICYDMWSLKNWRILVRSSPAGNFKDPKTGVFKRSTCRPILEVFADYGARKLDESEKVAHWATALFGHADAHVQPRIIPTGEIVALEYKSVENLESACDEIKLKTALCTLNHIFTDISKMDVGNYVLTHVDGEVFLEIGKYFDAGNENDELNESDGSLIDLTKINPGPAKVDFEALWKPLDPFVVLQWQRIFKRAPCTFPPRSDTEPKKYEGEIPKSPAKKRKNKSKKSRAKKPKVSANKQNVETFG